MDPVVCHGPVVHHDVNTNGCRICHFPHLLLFSARILLYEFILLHIIVLLLAKLFKTGIPSLNFLLLEIDEECFWGKRKNSGLFIAKKKKILSLVLEGDNDRLIARKFKNLCTTGI